MWTPPPPDLVVSQDVIHVWRVSLDAHSVVVQRYRDSLSVDEVERADRFYFERDRTRFTLARGVLRVLLGHYLRLEPAHLRFRYNPYGKPELDMNQDPVPLRFNVSHSAGLALYAVVLGREVGVDIEEVRVGVAFTQIAARTFSPMESTAFRTLPARMQPTAFFNCWTRKEAYIKARGLGLSLPLDEFDVSLVPGEPAMLLRTPGEPEAVRKWSLQALAPGPGFVGAVAAEGHDWQIACWRFRA